MVSKVVRGNGTHFVISESGCDDKKPGNIIYKVDGGNGSVQEIIIYGDKGKELIITGEKSITAICSNFLAFLNRRGIKR